ncbi:hypothetical protein HN587_06120 [Candidatus Woesearchaeota archaeon]|jgi:hypothetical protein|nr:hypothetical protein [Candidatus Woesearchaeota archaeon]
MKLTKRMFLIISILVTSFLLVGCGGLNKGNPDNPEQSPVYSHTGTEGIVMEFSADTPPQEIYSTTPLIFMVTIKNRGTYDVPSASFYLTGYDPRLINLQPFREVSYLEGKSQYNSEGGMEILEWESSDIHLQEGTPVYRPKFLLTACYPYETVASPIVCVDPNPTDQLSDKACTVQNVAAGSQGAPLAVTSIEQDSTPKGTFFRIHISNSGNGVVYSPTALAACPNNLDFKDLNKVYYENPVLGTNWEGDCKPSNDKLRLVNGKATIYCKFPQTAQAGSAFQTTLSVRLKYGYKNSISRDVAIKNIE